MKEIEHFTNQQIAVVPVEGFGPEPDEKAEPIAMGRQTLWGGLGRPPSREVMAAAAKAARSEMMQRIRETKGARGEGGGHGGRAPRPNSHVSRDRNAERPPRAEGFVDGDQPVSADGFRQDGPRSNNNRNRNRNRPQGNRPPRQNDAQPRHDGPRPQRDQEARPPRHDDDDFQPRANAHLGTQSGVNAFGHKTQGGGQRQPDPTRTSVDLMTERKRGGGGGYGRRNGGGGGRSGGGRKGGGGGFGGGGFSR